MRYWHYVPSGNHRKKPLTKEQLKKIQDAYAQADLITEHVQKLESEEESKTQESLNNALDSAFL